MGLEQLISSLGLPLAFAVYMLREKRKDDQRREEELARTRQELAACGAARRKEAIMAMESYVQAIAHIEKALKHAEIRGLYHAPTPKWRGPENTGATPPSDMASTRTPPTPSATVRDPSEITTTIIPRTPRPPNIHIRPEDHHP